MFPVPFLADPSPHLGKEQARDVDCGAAGLAFGA